MASAREHVNRAGAYLDDIEHTPYGGRDGRQLQSLYQAVREQQAALEALVEELNPLPWRPSYPLDSPPRTASPETR